MASAPTSKPRYAAALVNHDWLNIFVLPLIFALSVAGLSGVLNPARVTDVFIVYIVGDFLWIFFWPHSLPSKPNVILGHHIVTMGLLGFAWLNPEFAKYTCLDGLTEINTFFMVLRRQTKFARTLMHRCYWFTYIPLRLVLYPALIGVFWRVLEGYAMHSRLLVCTCQAMLCCFNFAVFWFSVRRRLVGRMSLKNSPPGTPVGTRVSEKEVLQSLQDGHLKKLSCQPPRTGQTNVYIRASAHNGAALSQ